MSTTNADKPKIAVLGGGFGGLEAAFYLRQRLGRRADITLVSESDTFLFKPNTIYIPFGKEPERFVFPIDKPLARRHIAFVNERVTGVDPKERRVLAGAEAIPYDYLIIATGAAMRPAEIPGLSEHANSIFTPAEMMRLRGSVEALVERARAGEARKVLFLVPPNNKCSGPLYEMVMMLDTWLRRQGARDKVSITYTTYEPSYIAAFGPRLHELVTREFAERGIDGHTKTVVARVEPGRVVYEGGETRAFDLLVSFPPYVAATTYEGLPSDERGFLLTDTATRQVKDHPDIYVVGDAGDFPVKQAFLALLQADAAAEHVSERVLHEEPVARFDPVSMCIMEQFDKATFAQVPLELTGDPARPVAVRADALDDYKVGTGAIWRVGKKMIGTAMPHRFKVGRPFHAGATWKTMEAGLKVMSAAFAD